MSKRPFISKRIDELEQIFKSSGMDLLTLHALENELVHRSVPRAVHLLKAVRKNLSLPEFKGQVVDPNLFEPQTASTKAADPTPSKLAGPPSRFVSNTPSPSPQPTSVTKWTVLPSRLVSRGEPIPFPLPAEPRPDAAKTMSPEEACIVLQVTLGANWETIEKSRSEIVQKSHPNKVRSLPPERRRALVEHARRANEAIQVLFELRIQQKARTSQLPEIPEATPEPVLLRVPR